MNSITKNIIKHASIYSIGRFASRAVGFLLIPLYTNYLKPEDYGIQELLAISIVLAGIIIQGGISAALFKFYNAFTSDSSKRSLISTILIFLTLFGLTFTSILWFFSDYVSYLLIGKYIYGYYVKLMLISFFFSIVSSVPETFLMAQKKSKLYTIITFVTLFFNLALNIYMVAIAELGILGILYASIIARILNTTINLAVTLPHIGFHFDFSFLKKILAFSIPLIPAELGMFIFSFSDRFFLSHMSNLESVGLYSLGFKFPFMMSFLIIQPFMQIWQQEMYEIKNSPEAPALFGNIFKYYFSFLILVGALMSVFIKDIIAIMTSPEFHDAWKVVPLIALAFVFRGIYFYFQLGMLFNNKTKYIGFVTLTGAIIFLCFNFVLVPSFNEIGAAMSQLFSYIFLGVASLVISQNLYKIKIGFTTLIKLSLILIITASIYNMIDFNSLLVSLLFRFSFIPVMLLTIFYLGLMPPKNMIKNIICLNRLNS